MEGGPVLMLHVGLDLSRTRVDVHVMDETGAPVLVTRSAPDSGGVGSLASRGGGVDPRGAAPDRGGLASRASGVGEFAQPVAAAIESMTGARFVHDQLE